MNLKSDRTLKKYNYAPMIEEYERAMLDQALKYGPGDKCTGCGQEMEGVGLCNACRFTSGENVCTCKSVSKGLLWFSEGWHIRRKDNTAVERCPTYWRDRRTVKNVTLERGTVRGGRRLEPGSYRVTTVMNIDPLNPLKLLANTTWERLFVDQQTTTRAEE